MLTTLFERLCEMSLIGSYTILFVLLARVFLKRCGRKYAYVLWGIVLINLCVPLSLQAPVSLIPRQLVADEGMVRSVADFHADSGKSGSLDGRYDPSRAGNTSDSVISDGTPSNGITSNTVSNSNPVSASNLTSASDGNESETWYTSQIPDKVQTNISGSETQSYKFSFITILLVIWGIGVSACAIWLSIQLFRMWKQTRSVKRMIIKTEGRIREAATCPVPHVWGIFKPVIYLPAGLSGSERDYVIAHEECHIRRKDYLWKLLGLICCTVHWFNPLVWLAYRCFCLDMEISCDEAVLRRSDEKTRAQYAESLLQFAARQNGYFGLALTFGEPSVKERIKGVLKYKRKPLVISGIALVSLIVLGIGLLVRPQSTEPANSTEPAQSGEAGQELQETPAPSNEERGNGPEIIPSSEQRGDGPAKTTQEGQAGQLITPTPEEKIPKSIVGYRDYTGYLDECYRWSDCDKFKNQDYDKDGKYDRVYRESVEGDYLIGGGKGIINYRIEFGNGDVLEIPNAETGSPEILAFDMTGDGKNEILFRQTWFWSTQPESGSFLLFEKQGGVYTKAKLPFDEDPVTGEYTLLCEEIRDGAWAYFMIPSLDFGRAVQITDEETWSWYEKMIVDLRGVSSTVWYAEPCALTEGTGLKCYVRLFDKWSSYRYEVTVENEDDVYKVLDIVFHNDESKSIDENINIITGTKILPYLWEMGVHIVSFERWDAEGNRTGYGKLEGVEPYSIPMDCTYTIAVNEEDIVVDYWAE